ncbi:DUF4202 domain-containing protein [Parendozoicomonas sp. Alg238-R29]|uniref:DUF4202 domain-containing protein n=1 Tax=Parendozoicomonas sp. Alg238-R29 TaxID=2993446 RepID=UPI00248D3E37|nr:DUF4202 domain-containing protein [Parendozoicomonas sp. Alg238-R29]
MSRLQKVIQSIDALHAQDPKQVDGKAEELIYAENCSRWQETLYPEASEELVIAVRSQHLCRWEIPRSDFPMDRTGYLKWRTALGKLHADKAVQVMTEQGYNSDSCDRTAAIIRKQGIKRNEEAQALEDCACLVFIETGFLSFAAKHSEEKIISIVQKTWAKMSERAQQAALKLTLPEQALTMLQKALA